MDTVPHETAEPGPAADTSIGRGSQVPRHDLEHMSKDWKWFLALGIGLVSLGTIALGTSFFVSVFTVALFGLLLMMAGVAQMISAFWAGKWNGLMLHVLIGILYTVTGFFLLDAPVKAAVTLTLLIAAFLIVGGVFRIVAAMMLKFSDWGWVLLSGVVSLMLGLLIYKQWPVSGLIVIGLFVGIELIFNGWAWIMLATGLRRVNKAK